MNASDQTPACTRCGRPTEDKVGEQALCDDCYSLAGSCCPEFEPEEE